MASLSNYTSSQQIRQWTCWGFLFAFFISGIARAQPASSVQVLVNVNPPYSAYLQDYAGAGQQVQIRLINPSGRALPIRLQGSVTGDNGVVIRTLPNYRPPVPFTLPPGTTLLSRRDLEGLFDLNQISVEGMDKNLLYQGKPLPEGNYQLCVQVFDNRTSQPLSAGEPLGCSPFFPVRAIEPPILIAPFCDGEVLTTTPQATIFTWSPPAGIRPTQVSYTIRVVELPLDNVDPNVFIDAVALPLSGLEVRNLPTSTFLYGPQYLPLKPGKRYAWRIQAVDRSGRLNLLNDGKSPVCAFRYGSVADTIPVRTDGGLVFLSPGRCDKPSANTLSAGTNNNLLLVWRMEEALKKSFIKAFNIDTTVTPTLLAGLKNSTAAYQLRISERGKTILERTQPGAFLQLPVDANFPFTFGNTYDISVELTGLTDQQRTQWSLPAGKLLRETCSFKLIRADKEIIDSTIIAGTLKFRYPGDANIYPLSNTRLRLQFVPKPKVMMTQTVNGPSKDNKGAANPKVIGQSIVTDAQGGYRFTVEEYRQQLGMAPGDTVPPAGFLRLLVDNPYFDQPTDSLMIPLQKEMQLADQILLARSYRLTVNARKTFDKKNWPQLEDKALDGQLVIIYRKPNASASYSELPPVEGQVERLPQPLLLSLLTGGTNAPVPDAGQAATSPTFLNFQGITVTPTSNTGSSGINLLPIQLASEPDPVYFNPFTVSVSEEQAQEDLKKAGYAFVASGTLKTTGENVSAQISRLLYAVGTKNSYYIYCPNLGQTMQGASSFDFFNFKKHKMDPQTPREEAYNFNISTNEAPRATFAGRMLYQFADPDEQGKVKPLANTPVRLVVTYALAGGKIANSPSSGFHTLSNELLGGNYTDNLKTLATTVTDAQGNFSFDAALDKPYKLGLLDANYFLQKGPSEFLETTSGALYRTFRVVVDNPYYASPAVDYGDTPDEKGVVQPFGTYALGDLTAVAQSYSLQVKAISDASDQNNGAGQALTGVDIYVLRNEKPVSKGNTNVIPPTDEGQNLGQTITTKNGKTYWLVAKGRTGVDPKTGQAGVVTFTKLIREDGVPNTDDYVLAGISNITSLNATQDKIADFTSDAPVEPINGIIDLTTNSKPGSLGGSAANPLFANDYQYSEVTCRKQFKPGLPRITIRAVDATRPQQGIVGANVILTYYIADQLFYDTQLMTDSAGYFTWQPPFFQGLGIITSKERAMTNVTISVGGKYGYFAFSSKGAMESYAHLELGDMKMGANYYNEKILLHPDGIVYGRVVRENPKPNEGAGVRSLVQAGKDGPIMETDIDGRFTNLHVHSPSTDSLFVFPNNKIYFEERLKTKPFKPGLLDYKFSEMGDITVYERDHRIRFRLLENQGPGLHIIKPVPNATVIIFDSTFTSDNQGYVLARFKNASISNLFMTIEAPGYVKKSVALEKNEESRQYVNLKPLEIRLDPAKAVKGTVVLKSGHTTKPLAGAEVFVSAGKGAGTLTTKSNWLGQFTLYVPQNLAKPQVQVTYADKSGKTYEGMTAEAEPDKLLALTVTTFDKFNLTTLYGFPVKLTSIVEQGKNAEVSGEVVLPMDVFRPVDPTVKLTFKDVVVGPDPNDPKQGIPVGGSILLGIPVLQTGYHGGGGSQKVPDYNVRLTGIDPANVFQNQLAITPRPNSTTGWIRAKAQIVDNSFKFPSSLLSYTSGQFNLFDPNDKDRKDGDTPVITAFVPSGYSGVIRMPYGLCKADGNPLEFKLLEFPATSKPAGSKLMGGEIWIAPDMQCTIPNAKPAKFTVSVDKIVLRNNTIDEQTGKAPLTIPLSEKWKLSVTNWKLDYKQGGFYAENTGKVVTGKVDIPLKSFNLRHNLFVMAVDSGKLGNLPLANVTTLQVGGQASFGYDTRTGSDQAGHWTLVFTPGATGHAATIAKANLPGLTSDLHFQTFSLLDNGEDILSFAPGTKSVRLYNLVDFTPRGIETGENYFALAGSMDVGIPRVPKAIPAQMRYANGPNGVALNLTMPKLIEFEAPGYVKFKNTLFSANKNNKGLPAQQNLPEIHLKENLIVMRGTVEEPGELDPLNVLLVHTPTATRMIHDVKYGSLSELADAASLPGKLTAYPQKVSIVDDSKYFDNVQCRMAVVGSDWERLRFSGNIAGVPGIKPNRLEFTVHGEIVANDQKVGVQGVEYGDAKFSLVYDLEKHHITGTANLPGFPMDGGMSFEGGAAQIRIGTAGFYVATSGQVNDVPLIVPVTVKAGMLVGYYDSRDFGDAEPIVFMFSHQKKFPCAFTDSFKGYFMIGEVPVPGLDNYRKKYEFGLGSAEIGVDAYVDSYFYGHYSGLSVSLTDVPKLSVSFGGGTSANVRAFARASALGGLLKVGGEIGLSSANAQNYTVEGNKLTVSAATASSGDLKVWAELYNPIPFSKNFKEDFTLGFCFNMGCSITIPDYTKPYKMPGISPSIGFQLSKCTSGCN